jgi:hypothetical protein
LKGFSPVIDNQNLKKKLNKEIKQLNLDPEQEALLLNELNYLSDLLIDVYIKETKNGKS